jgi:thiamine kinase-like enzyme
MNKIHNLFDSNFVKEFFKEKVLPHYPDVHNIGSIKIKPYKKFIWKTTYHVVIDFHVEFLMKNGKTRKTHIVCSAHSSEPREKAFNVLTYLWRRRLGKGVVLPRPLFYCPDFRASFYRALNGKDLCYYILKKDKETIKDLTAKAGLMLARLHLLKLNNHKLPEFEESNSKLATVIPGIKKISSEIKKRYGQDMQEKIVNPYYKCISKEEEYLSQNPKLCLIHGDFHTENIIRVSKRKVGLIDFTDFSLSDYARDLGNFLQQLEYKLELKFFYERDFIVEMKQLFLKEYLKESEKSLDDNLQARINNYYKWTALRTASYWLMKDKPEPKRAEAIIKFLDNFENKNLLAQD